LDRPLALEGKYCTTAELPKSIRDGELSDIWVFAAKESPAVDKDMQR
jgi:hypothetical protein